MLDTRVLLWGASSADDWPAVRWLGKRGLHPRLIRLRNFWWYPSCRSHCGRRFGALSKHWSEPWCLAKFVHGPHASARAHLLPGKGSYLVWHPT